MFCVAIGSISWSWGEPQPESTPEPWGHSQEPTRGPSNKPKDPTIKGLETDISLKVLQSLGDIPKSLQEGPATCPRTRLLGIWRHAYKPESVPQPSGAMSLKGVCASAWKCSTALGTLPRGYKGAQWHAQGPNHQGSGYIHNSKPQSAPQPLVIPKSLQRSPATCPRIQPLGAWRWI